MTPDIDTARTQVQEAADALGVSLATAKRRGAVARAWLARELADPPPDASG